LHLPSDVIAKTAAKYQEALARLTARLAGLTRRKKPKKLVFQAKSGVRTLFKGIFCYGYGSKVAAQTRGLPAYRRSYPAVIPDLTRDPSSISQWVQQKMLYWHPAPSKWRVKPAVTVSVAA